MICETFALFVKDMHALSSVQAGAANLKQTLMLLLELVCLPDPNRNSTWLQQVMSGAASAERIDISGIDEAQPHNN